MKINISSLRVNLFIFTLSLLSVLLLGCGNEHPPKSTSVTSPVPTSVVLTMTTIPKSITTESSLSMTQMASLSICLLILILFISYLFCKKKGENPTILIKQQLIKIRKRVFVQTESDSL